MRLIKAKILAAGLLAATAFASFPTTAVNAEEGMFMLDKVAGLPLREKGLNISPNEIYNPAGGGLSEAVIRLENGCSAEFVSPDGLILTNHHCGFDALVAASTTANNYGENGFKADSRETELPAKGFAVSLTLRSEDVTAQVTNGIDRADQAAVAKRIEELQNADKAKLPAGVTVQIQALNNGLFYYKFHYQKINDVRIAYAPPKSIGFFGGDPDNFEWSRHCGDFTFMRAYVAPDGTAAEYSANNVPFKPKKFLTISAEGVKENDLTMIIGYPGGTSRYRESYSVAFNQNINLPFTVDLLRTRISALETVGRDDDAKRIALQGEIFSLYNGLKAFDGGVAAMRRANLVAARQADEARLREWIAQGAARQTKYGAALDQLQKAYDDYQKTAQRDLILRNMVQIPQIELLLAVSSGQAASAEVKTYVTEVAKSETFVNRELLKFFLARAANLPADQRIAQIEKRFGSLQGTARTRAEIEFAEQAFAGDLLTTEKGLNSVVAMSPEQIRAANNGLISFAAEIAPEIAAAYSRQQALNRVVSTYRLPFIQAMSELKNRTPYPDANFTQRFSYGAVKGYQPKEAVSYTPFTTLNGVFEKDTGREPFNAPAKLRDLWLKKDFGAYNVNGTVPVNFLTTNDIIGGNSGSPVLNRNGEQVGIAFDGNYEGLGNDFFFSDQLGRTIIVDIRYVMFITEKFGNAGWILRELNVKGKAAAATAAAK